MHRLRRLTTISPLTLLITVATFALVAATYVGATQLRTVMTRHQVDEFADPIQLEVQGQLDGSMQTASAAAALLETQPGTTATEFSAFVGSLVDEFPAVTRVGFARIEGEHLPVVFDGPVDSSGISPRAGDDLVGTRVASLARVATTGPAVSNLFASNEDGGVSHCFVAVYPVRDASGTPIGWVYGEIDIDRILSGVSSPTLSVDISPTSGSDQVTVSRFIEAAQNVWTLRITSTDAFRPNLPEWMPTAAASGMLALVLSSGAVLGLIGAYRTDLKKIEAAEQEQKDNRRLAELENARLSTILEGHADGVITIDERGLIRSLNASVEELFGYAPEALIGRPVSMLMPEKYRIQHTQGMRRVAAGGESKLARQWLDLEGLTAGGEAFPLRLYIYPVDRNGAREFAGILRRADVDAAVPAKADYGADFIAHAAHEMKGTLFSLMLSLDMLKEQSDEHCDPSARRMLGLASGSAERLSALLQGMMDLRRVREGDGTLERHREDLSSVLFDALVDQQHKADERGVQFNINTEGDLRADVDRRWIRQVFANLLSNAVKYSPDGSEVRVWLTGDASSVTVRVSDRGPGIPAEFQPQMFQMFARAAGQQVSGNGIGLALTREIVELHGGSISFETAEGRGTAFEVRLPRHAAAQLASVV